MSDADKPVPGTIAWFDLTVPDAERLRDFYVAVTGWRPEPVSMGDYEDYALAPGGGGGAVAGVCHARGTNADLPPRWLAYVVVDDLDASMEKARALGGEIVAGPRSLAGGRFCVVKDPAGAVCALYAV